MVTDIVGVALLTVCITVFELLVPKRAVPPYEAVRLWEPPDRAATLRVATPDEFIEPVPSVAAPSLKVTVPAFGVVGPVTCATVAVSVVDWPNTVGLTELVSAVVVFSLTTRVPPPMAVPVWQPVPLPASTVKRKEPGGVADEVLIVRVEFAFPPVLVSEGGAKLALAPAGSDGGVWMLKGEVHALPLPLKLTVTE